METENGDVPEALRRVQPADPAADIDETLPLATRLKYCVGSGRTLAQRLAHVRLIGDAVAECTIEQFSAIVCLLPSIAASAEADIRAAFAAQLPAVAVQCVARERSIDSVVRIVLPHLWPLLHDSLQLVRSAACDCTIAIAHEVVGAAHAIEAATTATSRRVKATNVAAFHDFCDAMWQLVATCTSEEVSYRVRVSAPTLAVGMLPVIRRDTVAGTMAVDAEALKLLQSLAGDDHETVRAATARAVGTWASSLCRDLGLGLDLDFDTPSGPAASGGSSADGGDAHNPAAASAAAAAAAVLTTAVPPAAPVAGEITSGLVALAKRLSHDADATVRCEVARGLAALGALATGREVAVTVAPMVEALVRDVHRTVSVAASEHVGEVVALLAPAADAEIADATATPTSNGSATASIARPRSSSALGTDGSPLASGVITRLLKHWGAMASGRLYLEAAVSAAAPTTGPIAVPVSAVPELGQAPPWSLLRWPSRSHRLGLAPGLGGGGGSAGSDSDDDDGAGSSSGVSDWCHEDEGEAMGTDGLEAVSRKDAERRRVLAVAHGLPGVALALTQALHGLEDAALSAALLTIASSRLTFLLHVLERLRHRVLTAKDADTPMVLCVLSGLPMVLLCMVEAQRLLDANKTVSTPPLPVVPTLQLASLDAKLASAAKSPPTTLTLAAKALSDRGEPRAEHAAADAVPPEEARPAVRVRAFAAALEAKLASQRAAPAAASAAKRVARGGSNRQVTAATGTAASASAGAAAAAEPAKPTASTPAPPPDAEQLCFDVLQACLRSSQMQIRIAAVSAAGNAMALLKQSRWPALLADLAEAARWGAPAHAAGTGGVPEVKKPLLGFTAGMAAAGELSASRSAPRAAASASLPRPASAPAPAPATATSLQGTRSGAKHVRGSELRSAFAAELQHVVAILPLPLLIEVVCPAVIEYLSDAAASVREQAAAAVPVLLGVLAVRESQARLAKQAGFATRHAIPSAADAAESSVAARFADAVAQLANAKAPHPFRVAFISVCRRLHRMHVEDTNRSMDLLEDAQFSLPKTAVGIDQAPQKALTARPLPLTARERSDPRPLPGPTLSRKSSQEVLSLPTHVHAPLAAASAILTADAKPSVERVAAADDVDVPTWWRRRSQRRHSITAAILGSPLGSAEGPGQVSSDEDDGDTPPVPSPPRTPRHTMAPGRSPHSTGSEGKKAARLDARSVLRRSRIIATNATAMRQALVGEISVDEAAVRSTRARSAPRRASLSDTTGHSSSGAAGIIQATNARQHHRPTSGARGAAAAVDSAAFLKDMRTRSDAEQALAAAGGANSGGLTFPGGDLAAQHSRDAVRSVAVRGPSASRVPPPKPPPTKKMLFDRLERQRQRDAALAGDLLAAEQHGEEDFVPTLRWTQEAARLYHIHFRAPLLQLLRVYRPESYWFGQLEVLAGRVAATVAAGEWSKRLAAEGAAAAARKKDRDRSAKVLAAAPDADGSSSMPVSALQHWRDSAGDLVFSDSLPGSAEAPWSAATPGASAPTPPAWQPPAPPAAAPAQAAAAEGAENWSPAAGDRSFPSKSRSQAGNTTVANLIAAFSGTASTAPAATSAVGTTGNDVLDVDAGAAARGVRRFQKPLRFVARGPGASTLHGAPLRGLRGDAAAAPEQLLAEAGTAPDPLDRPTAAPAPSAAPSGGRSVLLR